MNLTKRFHVYVDRTDESMPRVFYVGKGMMRRVRQKTRSKHHMNISGKYGCVREVVFSTDDESLAFAEEIRLISLHRTFVYGAEYSGFGCNYTRGGDGAAGATHTLSLKTRQLLSEQKKGNRNALGYRKTMEQRLNQSRAMKGHAVSEETREKIRSSLKGRKADK